MAKLFTTFSHQISLVQYVLVPNCWSGTADCKAPVIMTQPFYSAMLGISLTKLAFEFTASHRKKSL